MLVFGLNGTRTFFVLIYKKSDVCTVKQQTAKVDHVTCRILDVFDLKGLFTLFADEDSLRDSLHRVLLPQPC